jgi:hypothetical protein
MKYPMINVPSEVPRKFLKRSDEKPRDKIAGSITPKVNGSCVVVSALSN